MKTIGIFEAKNRFPVICSQVAKTGNPVLVQRRGHPLVIISAAKVEQQEGRPDILTEWKKWEEENPASKADGDFPEVWKLRGNRSRNPLEE